MSSYNENVKGGNRAERSAGGSSSEESADGHATALHSDHCLPSAADSSQQSQLETNANPVMVKGSIWTQQVRDNTELEALRRELVNAKQTIYQMKEKEHKLKERLAEQAQKMLERGIRFENVCLGERRPASLIRRYGNLYAQARVDTLDALDGLSQLRNSDELKSKLLFSVVVLAFRSVKNTVSEISQQVQRLLQIQENALDPVSRDFQNCLVTYLSLSGESFDLAKNMEEVCTQIWATLYDYPSLTRCEGLSTYIKDCVKLAWCLTTQSPQFAIEYETRTFRREMHIRFHASNQESDTIKTYLWPALLEGGPGGQCVHKGVVVT